MDGNLLYFNYVMAGMDFEHTNILALYPNLSSQVSHRYYSALWSDNSGTSGGDYPFYYSLYCDPDDAFLAYKMQNLPRIFRKITLNGQKVFPRLLLVLSYVITTFKISLRVLLHSIIYIRFGK